jgi:hypothetical protein
MHDIHLLSYILKFVKYNPTLFLVNKRINYAYHLSQETYGINVEGIKIKFSVETSDHDGYCSDAENEYYDNEYNVNIVFDEKYYSYDKLRDGIKKIIDEIEKFCDEPNCFNKYRRQLKDLIPNICTGSGYCNNSYESIQHGLDIHDYRISMTNYDLY